MGNVLFFVENAENLVHSASLPGITFARKAAQAHGGKLYFLLLGHNLGGAAADAAKYGADGVITVDDPGLKDYLAETYAPIVARIAREKDVTLVAATATNLAKDFLPRAATLLEAGMASDVIDLVSAKSFKRPTNAGNVIATVEVTTAIVVASVRQSAFPPAEAPGGASAVEAAAAGPLNALGATFVGVHATKSERPDLSDAKIIVSGGRGMKEGKNFKILEELTDLLGGAMGASRAACDAGMVPNDLQVGQTGKVVAPNLYIAVAISGAIQHLAGMKGSKTIVAINKDPEAPIFQVADYGLVTTWEQAMPQLLDEVKKLKAAQR